MSHDPHDPPPQKGDSNVVSSSGDDSPQLREPGAASSQAGGQGSPADVGGEPGSAERASRPRILIGSQRDPAAYRPRPGKPVSPLRPRPSLPESARVTRQADRASAPREAREQPEPVQSGQVASPPAEPPPREAQEVATAAAVPVFPPAEAGLPAGPAAASQEVSGGLHEHMTAEKKPTSETSPRVGKGGEDSLLSFEGEEAPPETALGAEIDQLREQVQDSVQILAKDATRELFNRRAGLPPDLEAEFEKALENVAVDDLITETSARVKTGLLEPESRHVGKVLAVRGENVFIELGLREQGVVPLKLFREPPEVGQSVEVRVVRFVPEEGVYELVLPAAAADVADWADLAEGMMVEARVTGVNQGGLECEVNRIRGFIPISQIDLFRVEKPEEYVGQVFTCVVLEADPQRKNLVLSRRAVLEREREQAQRLLWDSLAPGQIREGVVRRLTEFGAFVDLGGVDGLLHISQIAWGRIKHPGEVLREGQTIKVRIDKVDRENRRISLGYRDLLYNPWEDADKKYVPQSLWKGRVTRIMDFGAFVELEPGIEGLVHISELSLKRVSRVSDVVKVGDEVDVMVLSFDPQEKKLSLSIRAALKLKEAEAAPAPAQPETAPAETAESTPPPVPKKQKPPKPLKGGLGGGPSVNLLDLLKK